MVFVVIVTSFLMCHSLKFFLNFYDGFFGEVNATSGSRIAGCFSNFLVVLNSSLNTIIYCVMNAKFRRYFLNVMKNMISSFCDLLCCKCITKRKQEDQKIKLKMISTLSKRSKCGSFSRGSDVAEQPPKADALKWTKFCLVLWWKNRIIRIQIQLFVFTKRYFFHVNSITESNWKNCTE